MLRSIVLVFISLSFAGGVRAEPYQWFVDLDCHLVDIKAPTPNACAHILSHEPVGDSWDGKIEKGWADRVYSAELRISLRRMGHYAVILSNWGENWQLSAFVGRPDSDFGHEGVFGRTFRSVHFDVPATRVEAFERSLRKRDLLRLQSPTEPMTRMQENGEIVSILCTDGAALYAKQFSDDYVASASRHSCRGRTKIDDFADALFDLAIEFDPELEIYRFTLPKDEP